MNSGHSNKSAAEATEGELLRPPREWLDRAYGNSPVPSLVVDDNEEIIFVNKSARNLLDVGVGKTLAELEKQTQKPVDTRTLASIVRTALQSEDQHLGWSSSFPISESILVRARCACVPAPSPMIVCRIKPCRNVDFDTRTTLFSKLAGTPDKKRRLRDAGRHLVETIHKYLHTPVVVVWYEAGTKTMSWTAGDEESCHRMASQSGPQTLESKPAIATFDNPLGTVRLSLRPADDVAATLLVATRTTGETLTLSHAFWSSLGTTAEAILQSATLLELNRRKRHRLRAIIEQMPMAVILFDTEGRILDMNLRARALVGRRNWTHIDETDAPYQVCDCQGQPLKRENWPLVRALRLGEGCNEESFVLDFGDRCRTVSVSVIPITDDRNKITSYMATGRDVTQRSKKEQRKNEFLSIASHELRGPLTPLSGLLHLAGEQLECGDAVDPELIDRAQAQVRRLERLIDGLLDISRLETGSLPLQPHLVDLKELLGQIIAPWLNGEHGERISVDLPDTSIMARVDGDRLDQVITNVIDNAIKHGRDDGQIDVVLSAGNDHAVFHIEDEGDGISQDIINRVFDRYFFGAEAPSSGTGLGLYVARQIVEDHNGTISIDSGAGEATTVTIRLPLHE